MHGDAAGRRLEPPERLDHGDPPHAAAVERQHAHAAPADGRPGAQGRAQGLVLTQAREQAQGVQARERGAGRDAEGARQARQRPSVGRLTAADPASAASARARAPASASAIRAAAAAAAGGAGR